MAHVNEVIADDDATMIASGPAAEAVAIADEEEDTSISYNDGIVVVPLGKEAEVEAGTATAAPASSTDASSSSSSERRRRFLIRNVRCGTYLDAGGATSADPSSIYLQPRNGQPAQQFSFF
jgi:hypothetical protein